MNTILTPGEISYLAMLIGADEVFGIPDIFFGKTDAEIRIMVENIAKDCLQNNLCTHFLS